MQRGWAIAVLAVVTASCAGGAKNVQRVKVDKLGISQTVVGSQLRVSVMRLVICSERSSAEPRTEDCSEPAAGASVIGGTSNETEWATTGSDGSATVDLNAIYGAGLHPEMPDALYVYAKWRDPDGKQLVSEAAEITLDAWKEQRAQQAVAEVNSTEALNTYRERFGDTDAGRAALPELDARFGENSPALSGVGMPTSTTPGVPPELSFGAIPFGRTLEEVEQLLAGAEIRESPEKMVAVHFVGHYGITRYFGFGDVIVANKSADGAWLDSTVVVQRTVSHPAWAPVHTTNLYFVKRDDTPTSPYVLFMVHKIQKASGGRFEGSFWSMAKDISAKLKKREAVQEGTYRQSTLTNKFDPAYIGLWSTARMRVLLLVRNDGGVAADAELVYIDHEGWQRLRAAHVAAEVERRKQRDTTEIAF